MLLHLLLTLEHWWHWWGMWYGEIERSVIEPCRDLSYYKYHGIFLRWSDNLLESRLPRPGHFHDSSNGLCGELDFSTPQIMNIIKGKVGVSISTIIIVVPLVAIWNTELKQFGITAAATTIVGARRKAWTKTRQCERKVWGHVWKIR